MASETRGRDPRDIITPDAFRVADYLLGIPLATPKRRAAAMLVDLLLIAVLSNAPAVFLAFAAAGLLVYIALRGPQLRKLAVRGALGCAGLVILGIGLVLGLGVLGDVSVPVNDGDDGGEPRTVNLDVANIGAVAGELQALNTAPDDSSVAAAAGSLAASFGEMGLRQPEIEDFVREVVSDPERQATALAAVRTELAGVGGWNEDGRAGEDDGRPGSPTESLAPTAAAEAAEDTEAVRAAAVPGTAPASEAEEVDSLLAGFRAARAARDSVAGERYRAALAEQLAAPELESRDARIAELEGEVEELEEEVDEAEDRAEAAEERAETPPGIMSVAGAVASDFGLGIGWSSVYFTFFIVWWKGHTPGKRLLGIRVVQLDGEPIGWWGSFTRFSGYAASLASGLIGFLQILWDANRQGLHDQVARTVVIREGAPRQDIGRARRTAG